VDSNGVRIAARDHGGEGQDMLLIPGGGRTVEDWALTIPHLRGFRVAEMDVRGHGASDPGDTWTWADVLGDTEAVVRELGLVRPFVVGHSLGGFIALDYGIAHPDCVGVVNVDGHGGREGVEAEWAESQELLPHGPEADAAKEAALAVFDRVGPSRESVVAPILDVLRAQATAAGLDWEPEAGIVRRSTERMARQLPDGSWRNGVDRGFMRRFEVALEEYSMLDRYRAVTCPTLVILAEPAPLDPGQAVEPLEAVRHRYLARLGQVVDAVAADRPNLTVRHVTGGHMVPLEAPAELAKIVSAWAAGLA
jgi:pimeloyl-ACP methyl ester carboxylesterase